MTRIALPLLADIDALKAANEELNALNNRLRISWREDTARIAIERDQWKKAAMKWLALKRQENQRKFMLYTGVPIVRTVEEALKEGWTMTTDDPRLVRAWEEQTNLRRVLSELLEQIDMLEGYELRRDPVDQYKVDAAWRDAIEQARNCL
jgi:hypothetical protein